MPPKPAINIVWFKRDLRFNDHLPLCKAIEAGLPTLLLYVFEPSLMAYPDWGLRHWQFVYHSLQHMNGRFAGIEVHLTYGEVPEVLDAICEAYEVKAIFSHEETGTRVTYDRDLRIAAYCQERDIDWQEYPTNAVVRKLSKRSIWPDLWKRSMEAPLAQPNIGKLTPLIWEVPETLILPEQVLTDLKEYPAHYQPAGERYAMLYLKSFLNERYTAYNAYISKPQNSRRGCSRLSPYLAWGNISLRQVVHATVAKMMKPEANKRALSSFYSRLHWHCHFIQKFEMECEMETQHVNRGFDALVKPFDSHLLQAWKDGNTGIPIIDANMRCAKATEIGRAHV